MTGPYRRHAPLGTCLERALSHEGRVAGRMLALRAALVVGLSALAAWLDVGLLWGATGVVVALLTVASAATALRLRTVAATRRRIAHEGGALVAVAGGRALERGARWLGLALDDGSVLELVLPEHVVREALDGLASARPDALVAQDATDLDAAHATLVELAEVGALRAELERARSPLAVALGEQALAALDRWHAARGRQSAAARDEGRRSIRRLAVLAEASRELAASDARLRARLGAGQEALLDAVRRDAGVTLPYGDEAHALIATLDALSGPPPGGR